MPADWRYGLTNAFPVPNDRRKKKRNNGSNSNYNSTRPPGTGTSVVPETGHHVLDAETLAARLAVIEPFRFLELPSEIRNRIYGYVVFATAVHDEGQSPFGRTTLLVANRQVHREAAYVLYSNTSFKIFPLQDFMPKPVILELHPMYRAMVKRLQMVVGSSWTSPPKTWRVSKLLAKRLAKLDAARSLKVFVEVDPSLPFFDKYRISPDFYTHFCGDLLRDVLDAMPQLESVEVDGNPGVDRDGPLASRLWKEAESKGLTCTWGPTRVIAGTDGPMTLFASDKDVLISDGVRLDLARPTDPALIRAP